MFRLGVMGGTFDPPHKAHIAIAEEAMRSFKLDKVLFIPTGTPPHKPVNDITDAEHRYAMTKTAIEGNPGFEVSRMEIDRKGPSYSIDTIRSLKEIYPPGTEIYFIIGADEALELPKWYESEKLPGLTRFIAAPRSGFNETILKNRLPEALAAAVDILSIKQMEISATDIRQRLSSGDSVGELVSESVVKYIKEHRLY